MIREAAPATGFRGLRGSQGLRRGAIGVVAVCALLVTLAVLPVSSSFASEHLEITGEYGKTGPKSSGLGAGCRIAWDSGAEHLLLFSDGKIYGLSVSPGTATELGGHFPISTGINTSCGEPDMDVDPGTGNIFAVQSGGGGEIFGWNRSGEKLPSPWPVSIASPREICGVDVSPSGEAWGGNYSGEGSIVKFKADGTSNGTITVGFNLCKFAVDRSNGDIFVQPYSGGEIVKFSAASGYTTQTKFPSSGSGNPGLAVNGAEQKLYVTSGNAIKVYNTETAALVETVALPGVASGGIAVDEGTDTLFATVGSGESGYIAEYLGITTPKATTGEPIGNSEVSGTANPNGVGPITECYFEYGLTTGYGKTRECAQSLPISSEEGVTANLAGPNNEEPLVGEETYHYRLVLGNGEPHVVGKGSDKTIVPHNVKGLTTESPTEVTQESAIFKAGFEGTGEDTHYYFEYGQTTQYGHTTAIPPGDDAGVTTGPSHVSTEVTGLEPGITYHYRVVGENSVGVSKANDRTFKTTELPAIVSATTSNVTETSAEVDATINPHEFETEYFVEYGSTLELGAIAPVSHGILAASNTDESVAVQLSGLQGITYYFRVVAISRWGRVETEIQSFNFYPQSCPNAIVRQQNESQYLPECRSYELVSPEEAGAVQLSNTEYTTGPYASNPPRFAFAGGIGGVSGTEPTNSGGDTYIATRTSSGWKTHLVGIRGYEGQSAGPLFPNPDFSKFFDFDEAPAFAGQPQPPHHIPYIWDSEGNPIERWPTNFEDISNSELSNGAWQPSPDLTHLAFSSTNIAFTSDGRTTGAGSAYDYDATTRTTTLISKDADGHDIEVQSGATPLQPVRIFFPGEGGLTFEGPNLVKETPQPHNPPVSTDGSHILMGTASGYIEFFTHPLPPMRLYMRVNDLVTYEVSDGHNVSYLGMTADGTKVFFTSPEKLTAEDTDNSVDLYMWSESGGQGKITLVSKAGEGAEGSGNSDACSASWTSGCGVKEITTASGTDNSISAEGGEIYFYSPEQLDGSKGIPNQENLYVYRNGSPRFVTTLSPTGGASGPVSRIQVAPDGGHAAFITASRVTSYDNAGKAEMYSYDAMQRKLVCVSCTPDGLPPTSNVEGSKMGLFMSNDGRTFFSTEDALVPTDTNGEQDVYEYVEGRPQLITTGTGTSQAGHGGSGGSGNAGQEGLAGVSADGIDVYFSTRDILVPQNNNGPFLAFYDARTDGGFAYEPPLAPCEAADECHGPGNATPTQPTVTSETGLGSRGNAATPKKQHKAKPKRRHRRHQERRGKRSHGAERQRQGGNNRHA